MSHSGRSRAVSGWCNIAYLKQQDVFVGGDKSISTWADKLKLGAFLEMYKTTKLETLSMHAL